MGQSHHFKPPLRYWLKLLLTILHKIGTKGLICNLQSYNTFNKIIHLPQNALSQRRTYLIVLEEASSYIYISSKKPNSGTVCCTCCDVSP